VQAGGDLASAEAALKVMGVTDPDELVKGPSFEVPGASAHRRRSGRADVSAGQLLQPGTTQCFMISDTSTVWVLVNVYQKDLPYVRVGDTVTIQTDAYPDAFTDAFPTSRPRSIRTLARCRRALRPTIPARS
jgi:cobalt-zinc-cadmium efflux system membrane fusion protein